MRSLCILLINLCFVFVCSASDEYDGEAFSKELKKKAEQGDAESQMKLSKCYMFAKGVDRNYEKCAYWCAKAAIQNLAESQYGLGILYENGQGVEQDSKKAAEWIRKAAEQGLDSAQAQLGYYYFTGGGVPQDSDKAIYWLRKASLQKDSNAMWLLGIVLISQDMFKDKNSKELKSKQDEALKWFKKSAEAGNPQGQSWLGSAYHSGGIVGKDIELAKKWLRKAAEQGDDTAKNLLNTIAEEETSKPK
jgi:TPR repeat protein